ncbi:MAG: glycosyltransferase family 4 protein [Butyrivibrio sp.]
MIVGIDGHMIGDHSGGNESYYTNILLNMKKDDGDEFILFLKEGVDSSLYEKTFKIVRFKEKSSFKRNFFELPRLCKKYNLDVLHTQYFIPFHRPCPVVCTIHDICFEHYKDIFTRSEYIRQKLLIPYAAKKSCKIFTVSNDAKNDIVRHYGVSPKNVIVTYNAVSSDFHNLSSDELKESDLREKFGIGNSRYVLSVANLQPRKNLPRLIRAYRKAQQHRLKDDTKLVIVGKKAWMYNDIIKEACEDNDKIVFTDYVSNEDLVRLYNAAACFVYPSFFEGFGIPPLEAMACGTPVAVANTTSLPEVVGDAGLYFDPFDEEKIEDAIVKLLEDDELRNKLISMGYERAGKFSWKKSSEIIVNAYKTVAKGENYEQ